MEAIGDKLEFFSAKNDFPFIDFLHCTETETESETETDANRNRNRSGNRNGNINR